MVGIDDIWHGPELLKKMLSAKLIGNELVREIYAALEVNNDLTGTWVDAKHMAGVNYPDRPATIILAGGGGVIF